MPKEPSLKALRTAKKLSKYALARLSGVSEPTILRAERKNSWPKHKSARRALEIALGIAP